MEDARRQCDGEEDVERFVHEAAHGLATLGAEDLVPGNLTVLLGLSVWMRRGGVEPSRARRALLGLREALLEVSGLDARTEPVPLVVADPAAAVVSLAVYLEGLLTRAAATAATSRHDVASRATAVLVV